MENGGRVGPGHCTAAATDCTARQDVLKCGQQPDSPRTPPHSNEKPPDCVEGSLCGWRHLLPVPSSSVKGDSA